MKELLLVGAGILVSWALSAQTLGEWFNQNGTQLSELQEQIAALQVYAKTLQTGYHVISSGLQTIDRIQEGDFTLHSGYFSSLDETSPAVVSDRQVAMIRLYNARLPSITTAIVQKGQQWPAWAPLTAGIASNIIAAGNLDGQLLDQVLTDGQLRLEDAERLALIGTLYAKAKDRYDFALDVLEKLSER